MVDEERTGLGLLTAMLTANSAGVSRSKPREGNQIIQDGYGKGQAGVVLPSRREMVIWGHFGDGVRMEAARAGTTSYEGKEHCIVPSQMKETRRAS